MPGYPEPPSPTAELGRRIAAARDARGLTQEALSDAVGVSRSAVAQWETGRATPHLATLTGIASTLGTTLSDMFAKPEATAGAAPAARFNIRNLSVLAYANGFTLWHYRNPAAPITACLGAGFFQDAADMLTPGDIMFVSGSGAAACVVVAGCAPVTFTGLI